MTVFDSSQARQYEGRGGVEDTQSEFADDCSIGYSGGQHPFDIAQPVPGMLPKAWGNMLWLDTAVTADEQPYAWTAFQDRHRFGGCRGRIAHSVPGRRECEHVDQHPRVRQLEFLSN